MVCATGASLDRNLDGAQFAQLKTIAAGRIWEFRGDDAARHDDVARAQTASRACEMIGEPGHGVEGMAQNVAALAAAEKMDAVAENDAGERAVYAAHRLHPRRGKTDLVTSRDNFAYFSLQANIS